MDLRTNDTIMNINYNQKNTASLGFFTLDGKLIIRKEYPSETNIIKIIKEFLNNNDEFTLKSFLHFGEDFNKDNLIFYRKISGEYKRIELNEDKNKNKDELRLDYLTLSSLGEVYYSFSTLAMSNFDDLKIYVSYENIYKNIVENFENYITKNMYLIAKPILNKHRYYLYNKNFKEYKMISLTEEDKKIIKLENFSLMHTYCNAKNNLYIYESNFDSYNPYSRFFNINLVNNKTDLISSTFPKRQLHSMIYIPSCYIFIIGGKNTKEVLIYEINEKDKNTSYDKYPHQLEKALLEPSLISINNKFIYILENSTISLNIYRFNVKSVSPFEKINLGNKNSLNIEQKFFGVVKNKDSILFLGGQMLTMDNNKGNKNCYEFNYETNKLVKSQIPFTPSNFIEKTFIPIGDEIYIQFTEYKKNNGKKGLKKVQFDGKEQEMENTEII